MIDIWYFEILLECICEQPASRYKGSRCIDNTVGIEKLCLLVKAQYIVNKDESHVEIIFVDSCSLYRVLLRATGSISVGRVRRG